MKLYTVLTSGGITVTDGKSSPVQVAESHPKFKSILSLIEEDGTTIKDVLAAIDIKSQLSYKDENIEIFLKERKPESNDDDNEDEDEDDDDSGDKRRDFSKSCDNYDFDEEEIVVKVKDRIIDKIPEGIKHRILSMIKDVEKDSCKFNFAVMGKFLSRLYQNPSFKVVNQLYRFLESNNLPITQDGNFLAYKKVDYDYRDLRTHTIRNHIGKTVYLPRNEVEDDPRKVCAPGLHVCSKDYLSEYGSDNKLNRVVIVKIDPVNVVSVPTDYNNAKMRVCEYIVVDEITDFDAQLADHYYGKHPKGWINRTLSRIKDFYVQFWSLDVSKSFIWGYIPGRDGYWNAVVRDKFIAAVKEEFGYDIADGQDNNSLQSIAYHPLQLFANFSYHDSESSLTSPEQEILEP